MLHDRRYMAFKKEQDGRQDPSSGLKCLYALIIVNILALILVPQYSDAFEQLSLSPQGFLKEGRLWQPLTAIFLHAGFFHLFFNMFTLFIFGALVAPVMGASKFLRLFLFSGLFGNLVWLLSSLGGFMPLVGASGAVMGVIMASAMMAPNQEMLMLFVPFPVKLKTMATVFVLIDVLCEMLSPPSRTPVAYMAHIGGFAGGYLYMSLFMKELVEWDFLAPLKKAVGLGGGAPKGWRVVTPQQPKQDESGRVTQAELDRILDKISASGVNSLSEEEMETLRRAREQMKGQF